MRAARVHAWASPPIVEDVAAPSPRPGETLVAVSAAAVGHFDLSVTSGHFQPRPPLPYVPGTDGAGRVVASESFPPGTTVRIGGGGIGLCRDGTWAEQVAVPDNALEPIPAEVDAAVAASFSVPGSAAYTALHQLGRLRPGERVAVTGAAGAVGSIAVQLARHGGAAAVVGIVSRAAKAASVPADATVVVGRGQGAVEALKAHTDGVDLLVDTVGGPDLPELLGAVSPGGRVVLVGYTAGREVTFDLPALMERDVSLLPLNLVRRPARTRQAAATVLGLLSERQIQLPITRFVLDDLPSALDRLVRGTTVGRVVVVPASTLNPSS